MEKRGSPGAAASDDLAGLSVRDELVAGALEHEAPIAASIAASMIAASCMPALRMIGTCIESSSFVSAIIAYLTIFRYTSCSEMAALMVSIVAASASESKALG